MTVLMLRYRGGGAFRPSLPARDIDHAELAAMAAARKTSVDAIAEEAVGSGLYLAVLDEPDVPRGTSPQDRHAELEHMVKAQLLETAATLGLDLGKRPTNPELVEAIELEEARLEAAAARHEGALWTELTDDEIALIAAEYGIGTDGLDREATIAALVAATEGAVTPGDDPGAVASGEPGMRPEGANG